MYRVARQLHRRFSPLILVLLAVSAITGMAFRLGKAWFRVDGQTGQKIMEFHTGAWIHESVSVYYVLFVGLGALLLIITGAVLAWKSRSKAPVRRWHRVLGVILLLPLTATVLSGVLYAVGREWLNFPEEVNSLLMVIHEGRWLGKQLRPFYVLFVGIGVLTLGFSGLWLLRPGRKKSSPAS